MRALTLILCLTTVIVKAQETLPMGAAGLITFEEVVEVPKMQKGLLFENAKAWITEKYKSPRTIQAEDANEGTISAKSMFKIMSEPGGSKPGGVINFTLDISVKPGKYRYTITNLRHTDKTDKVGSGGKLERAEPHCTFKKMKEEQWLGIKAQTKTEMEKLIEEFKKGMAYTSPDKSDDF
ncbi:MAG: DUF4468 domain-containing protein [Flavobacteriales bacterium]|nr:DUF4468 domain-containing protein [Flavobacteriales bacterium]